MNTKSISNSAPTLSIPIIPLICIPLILTPIRYKLGLLLTKYISYPGKRQINAGTNPTAGPEIPIHDPPRLGNPVDAGMLRFHLAMALA